MNMATRDLSAHEKPPSAIKGVYKRFQKATQKTLEKHPDLIDPYVNNASRGSLRPVTSRQLPRELQQILQGFLEQGFQRGGFPQVHLDEVRDRQVFEVTSIPGKLFKGSVIPQKSEIGRFTDLSVSSSSCCSNQFVTKAIP